MNKAPTAKKASRGIANQHRDDTIRDLQSKILLDYLSHNRTCNAEFAKDRLGVEFPVSSVQELRKQGYTILDLKVEIIGINRQAVRLVDYYILQLPLEVKP